MKPTDTKRGSAGVPAALPEARARLEALLPDELDGLVSRGVDSPAHEYQIGTLEEGRLELVTTPAMVLQEELTLFTPASDPPERPERRTVWPALGGGSVSFEMQESSDGGASWTTSAAVSLERVW